MTTDENDWRITAYLHGELEPAEREEFERRMASDPALRALVDEYQSLAQGVAEVFEAEPSPTLEQSQRRAVEEGRATTFLLPPEAESARVDVPGEWAARAVADLLLLEHLGPGRAELVIEQEWIEFAVHADLDRLAAVEGYLRTLVDACGGSFAKHGTRIALTLPRC